MHAASCQSKPFAATHGDSLVSHEIAAAEQAPGEQYALAETPRVSVSSEQADFGRAARSKTRRADAGFPKAVDSELEKSFANSTMQVAMSGRRLSKAGRPLWVDLMDEDSDAPAQENLDEKPIATAASSSSTSSSARPSSSPASSSSSQSQPGNSAKLAAAAAKSGRSSVSLIRPLRETCDLNEDAPKPFPALDKADVEYQRGDQGEVLKASLRWKLRTTKMLRENSSTIYMKSDWVQVSFKDGESHKCCIQIQASSTGQGRRESSFGASEGHGKVLLRFGGTLPADFPELAVRISAGRDESGPDDFRKTGVKPTIELAGAKWNFNEVEEYDEKSTIGHLKIIVELTPKTSA
mmetsp:Transcript_35464/g.89344  ORF Transcript_35464/g.89344 Transcript_35464/m.89344 type:complete len:352 (+) Transcript_35464:187-1242(+)